MTTTAREPQITEPLPHDRSVEELEIVALGAAPPEITAGVLAHAAECSECRAELDELTLLLAALTVLIPETELNRGRSAGIRSRLMTRTSADTEAAAKRQVAAAARRKEQNAARMPAMAGWERIARATHDGGGAADPAGRPTPRAVAAPPVDPARFGRGAPLLWAIIATVTLLLVGAVAVLLLRDEEDTPAVTTAQIAELEAREDSLVRVIAERERAVDALVGPSVRIVDLVNWTSGGRPIARVFWDVQNGRWTLFVYELRPPRPDHTYQLWALTAQGRISAGTFLPDENGTGRMEATVAFNPTETRSVFITEEPLPGTRLPTGRPLAAGSF